MKILVLNDKKEEFESIKDLYPQDEVVWSVRYLQFLHEIDEKMWDVIYLDYDISEYVTPDSWTDGNGHKKSFNGIHAARAISTLRDINRCPTQQVIITTKDVEKAYQMYKILKESNVQVSRIALNVNDEK
jgi:hypothetical protein